MQNERKRTKNCNEIVAQPKTRVLKYLATSSGENSMTTADFCALYNQLIII